MLTNVSRSRQIAARVASTAAQANRQPYLRWNCNHRAFNTVTSLSARRHLIYEGRFTQTGSDEKEVPAPSPYYFETGYSIFAKRPTRPFPPPFVSRPSGSFSDPLTTHDRAKYREARVQGQLLRGITNGDDAIIVGHHNFLAVNDGVGAWAQKERGHAALWSRLIAHYWAVEYENVLENLIADGKSLSLESVDPALWLQHAFEKTKEASSLPNEILGTTTATCAVLHHNPDRDPVVITTQLGDCAVLIIRPSTLSEATAVSLSHSNEDDYEPDPALTKALLYKTTEQWHWFDCPRQLGTNSPDTPDTIAVTDTVPVQLDDVVVVVSDGVTDNLWDHEITAKVCETFHKWRRGDDNAKDGVIYMARELMNAARVVAMDPYAESPYMERALDEGLTAEGGKLDDISVLIGICRKKEVEDD